MPKHREQWNYLEELIKSLEPSNLHDIMMRLGEVAGTPPKVSKPRKKLKYLLNLIASLGENNFYIIMTCLEEAADKSPHDKEPTIWSVIRESINQRRLQRVKQMANYLGFDVNSESIEAIDRERAEDAQNEG